MRIAQKTVTRNYMRDLNSTLAKRAQSLERGASGLKFSRLSENVADGVRAMRLQEERVKSEAQRSTVKSMQLELNSVDSNLDSIDSILQLAQEKTLKAMSESYGETSQEVLAQEIAAIREQLVQFANATFNSKYLFSGTNNATPPFGVDASGKLTFNGIAVEDIEKDPVTGKYVYHDGSGYVEVPHSGDIYMDIGIGIKMANGEPDPRTAFKISVSGLDIMGFGAAVTGANGHTVANNLYDCLTELEAAIKSGDSDLVSDLYTQLVDLNDSMRMTRTDVGTRMNFLERTETRLTADIDNITERESGLVTADPAEESINMKMYEYVWQAILSLGSSLLPQSLLDFIR